MHLARRSPLAICLAGALAVFHSGALCSQESGVLAGTVEAEIDKAVAAYRAPARSASSVDYEAAQALRDIYAGRADAPLWSHDGHPSAQAEALLGALQRADTYGLQPEDYAGDALTELAGKPSGSTPADAARWACPRAL